MSEQDGVMQGTVRLLEGMAFEARSGSGHVLTVDAGSESGGEGRGSRPLELLLLGLGGCTGMDVISILRKMRQDISHYEVRVRAERADEHPRVFTSIVVEHVVVGHALNPESVKRAVELSTTRYCSALAMLAKAADVAVTYRIADDTPPGETQGTIGATH